MDLSKELKENIAVSFDRVSCLVDVISDLIVRFASRVVVILKVGLRGLVFGRRIWLALRCRFLSYGET
jgi:hypothetical protein